jgi:hypothetical protein
VVAVRQRSVYWASAASQSFPAVCRRRRDLRWKVFRFVRERRRHRRRFRRRPPVPRLPRWKPLVRSRSLRRYPRPALISRFTRSALLTTAPHRTSPITARRVGPAATLRSRYLIAVLPEATLPRAPDVRRSTPTRAASQDRRRRSWTWRRFLPAVPRPSKWEKGGRRRFSVEWNQVLRASWDFSTPRHISNLTFILRMQKALTFPPV